MSNSVIAAVGAVFSSVIFIGLIVLFYKKKNPTAFNKKAAMCDKTTYSKKVAGICHRFAKQNSFKYIIPAKFSSASSCANLSAVIIGYFGVLGVISIGYDGEIYGESGDEKWLYVSPNGSRNYFENPITEAATAVRVMREALFKSKIKKVPVEVVYVFANPNAQLIMPRSLAPMRTKNFSAMLKKEKYLQDCGLDLSKAETALKTLL